MRIAVAEVVARNIAAGAPTGSARPYRGRGEETEVSAGNCKHTTLASEQGGLSGSAGPLPVEWQGISSEACTATASGPCP